MGLSLAIEPSGHYLYQPDPDVFTAPREKIVCGRCSRGWADRDKDAGWWSLRCNICGNMVSEHFWSKWGFYVRGRGGNASAREGRDNSPSRTPSPRQGLNEGSAPGPTLINEIIRLVAVLNARLQTKREEEEMTEEAGKKKSQTHPKCKRCKKKLVATNAGTCFSCFKEEHNGVGYREWRKTHRESPGGGVIKARKPKEAPAVPPNPEKKETLREEINRAFTLAELEEAGRKIAASHPVKTVSAPARARLTVITLEMDGSPPMELIAQLFEVARGR